MRRKKGRSFSKLKDQVAVMPDKPVGKLEPQQPQQGNTLDPTLLGLLHAELGANPEAQSLTEFDAQLKKYLQVQLCGGSDVKETKNQMTEKKELWRDILDREQNFYDSGEWTVQGNESFLAKFEELYKSLEAEVPALNKVLGLQLIYSRTYDFLVAHDFAFSIFGRTSSIYKNVFDVCMFTGLCMFLHNTKRLKGMPLSQYLYAHSRFGFNNKKSTNYIEHEGSWKQGERTDSLDSQESTMRQFRHRLYKFRPVDNRRTEWSAVPKSSEHEWQLYFDYVDAAGNADPQLKETLKRIKNLYNGVNQAIHSPEDDEYEKRLKDAWTGFESKLHKIKYENYLDLCKALLVHIEKERVDAGENWWSSTYYGINLYRFEKELCVYELTNYVKRLLKCGSNQEVIAIVNESLALQNICFPQIRNDFCQYRPIEDVGFFARQFSIFIDQFISLSRLLVDKFIEEGHLSEKWESLFLEEINRKAKKVLYDPQSIDYDVEVGAQEVFEKLLSIQTDNCLRFHIELWKYKATQEILKSDCAE